ncbi:hypothetical protein HU200_021801 [Digitaria exilis]|uniref:RanBP2-type domain-containing protein n=1 Tax=Digitaria exilis TaxID=1010633 RepID=A0A835KAI7_9POAL|nr:hypothetical protein HU200_021801 [Digitaria exilis]
MSEETGSLSRHGQPPIGRLGHVTCRGVGETAASLPPEPRPTMASRSRSPPPSPDELKWACGACAVLNSLYSNSCGACETRRPLEVDARQPHRRGRRLRVGLSPGAREEEGRPVEVDADSPVVVAATPAPAPRRRRRKKRDRAPAVAEAERPVEVDADSPIVAADASASPPLKACGRKRECDPAVSVADRPVEVDADSPVVVATTPASAPRRRRRKKKDRAPAVAEEERPVEVDASASPHLRVRGGKRKRAASLDVVEICDSAGREGGGEGKAPAAKKGLLAALLQRNPWKFWEAAAMQYSGDMNWDDKGDGPFPLQDGWIDAWVELKPGDDGWTYDTKANGMLSGNCKLQKRMDRFLCKLEDFKIDNIEMIGKEAIPGISYFRDKKPLPMADGRPIKKTLGKRSQ